MKKLLALFLLTAFTLCGCGKKEERYPLLPDVPSGISYQSVIESFEQKLSSHSEQYSVRVGTPSDVGGGNHHVRIDITEQESQKAYIITLAFDEEECIWEFRMETDTQGEQTDASFSLLAFYLYESVGLPQMDAQSFYDYYVPTSDKPHTLKQYSKWYVKMLRTNSKLHFSGMYDDNWDNNLD